MEIPNVDTASFAYNDLTGIDRWSTWTPVWTSLTTVGDLSTSGRFRVVGRSLQFQVRVSAATSIASTAGTTFFALPAVAKGLAGIATMSNQSTNVAVGVCVVDTTNSRVYVPTQGASGSTFTVAGWMEI